MKVLQYSTSVLQEARRVCHYFAKIVRIPSLVSSPVIIRPACKDRVHRVAAVEYGSKDLV
jgi:hypothetical protein